MYTFSNVRPIDILAQTADFGLFNSFVPASFQLNAMPIMPPIKKQ